IDQMRSYINILREHLKKEQQKAKFEKDKYETLANKLQKEKDDLLAKAVRQAEKKIEELIQQAKADQTFKRHTALQEIRRELPEIVKSKPGGGHTTIETADDFAKKYPPGTKVYVPSLHQDGLVQSTPNNKGEVMILSNSLRLTLPWQELKPPDKAQNPTASLVRRVSGGNVTVALSDAEKTIDLRGQTVEEAISSLEIELDNSASHKEDRIKIIHGHGTEALKKAVRTYLSRSVYVKKWKAGSNEQGGDGITWAELSDD
ncbi:MAG: Smr/MutS family protein, partial [Pseudobdellovibrionaceae bacterium]